MLSTNPEMGQDTGPLNISPLFLILDGPPPRFGNSHATERLDVALVALMAIRTHPDPGEQENGEELFHFFATFRNSRTLC